MAWCLVRCGRNGMGYFVLSCKSLCDEFVRGVKNGMGCFVLSGKSFVMNLSVVSKMAWDVLS